MYITEALANLEGIERGPAGNTALAAAFSLAQELPADEYRWLRHAELGLRMELDLTQK